MTELKVNTLILNYGSLYSALAMTNELLIRIAYRWWLTVIAVLLTNNVNWHKAQFNLNQCCMMHPRAATTWTQVNNTCLFIESCVV